MKPTVGSHRQCWLHRRSRLERNRHDHDAFALVQMPLLRRHIGAFDHSPPYARLSSHSVRVRGVSDCGRHSDS